MLKLKDIENDVRLSNKAKELLKISLDIKGIKAEEILRTLKESLPAKLGKDYSEETINNLLNLKPEKLLDYILTSKIPDFNENYDKLTTFNTLLDSKLKLQLCNYRKSENSRKSLLVLNSYYYYGEKIFDLEAFDFIKKSVSKISVIDNRTSLKVVKRFGLSKSNIKYFLKDVSKENVKKAFENEVFMLNLLNYLYMDKLQSRINTVCKIYDNSYEHRLKDLKSSCCSPIITVNNNAIDSIPKYNIEIGVDIDINEYDNKNVINYTATTLLAICNAMFNLGFN